MNYTQVKCHQGKRLLDVVDGAHLRLQIKCGNQKACPYKASCHRTTRFTKSTKAIPLSEPTHTMNCPICQKRLFDVSPESSGIVAIKCDSCNQVSLLQLSPKIENP